MGTHRDISINDNLLRMTIIGTLLAFNAGMINATTVSLPKHLPTSAMTGACTMIGVTLADGNFIQFSQSLGVVFFHIAGAAVSGYLISSHLWLRIVFGSLMVGTAAIINVFFPNSILLYFFAAMFTGLQNSTSSSTSGNVLRTTHVSSGLSEIGLICGRLQSEKYWRLALFAGIVLSFFAGALCASWSYRILKTKQFFVNFVFFSLLGVFLLLFCHLLPFPDSGPRTALNEDLGPEAFEISEGSVASSQSDLHSSASSVWSSHICSPQPSPANSGNQGSPISNPALSSPANSNDSREVWETEEVEPGSPWTYGRKETFTALLSFHSGFLNATTFLSSRSLYTLHMTGNITVLATDLLFYRFSASAIRCGLVVSYLLGSFLTGLLLKAEIFSTEAAPWPVASFGLFFLVGLALLTLALLWHLLLPQSPLFYFLVAAFSGLQSSVGCRIDRVLVRTTFMSGAVTDIGTSLGSFFRTDFSFSMPPNHWRTSRELGVLAAVSPSVASFILGSFLATLLFPLCHPFQLCVSIALFLFIGVSHTAIVHH